MEEETHQASWMSFPLISIQRVSVFCVLKVLLKSKQLNQIEKVYIRRHVFFMYVFVSS